MPAVCAAGGSVALMSIIFGRITLSLAVLCWAARMKELSTVFD
jgi:hypothetical protein